MAPAAALKVQEGIIGDVAGRHLPALLLDALKELGGQGEAILEEFLVVLGADGAHRGGDRQFEAGSDFFDKLSACFNRHFVSGPFLW